MIHIDENRLELLLEKNKEQITPPKHEGVDTLFSAISFFLSTIFASYTSIGVIDGITIKVICFVTSIVFGGWGLHCIRKNKSQTYDCQKLLADIIELNEERHSFSIIAIKDTFNEFPNRFLLYYDARWKCWLFLNCKTKTGESENIAGIQKYISSQLKVGRSQIVPQFIECRIQKKFSVSDQVEKYYEHKLYLVSLPLGDRLQQDSFEIDSRKYRWMTIDEMEADNDITEKNSDVVSFVKDCI